MLRNFSLQDRKGCSKSSNIAVYTQKKYCEGLKDAPGHVHNLLEGLTKDEVLLVEF